MLWDITIIIIQIMITIRTVFVTDFLSFPFNDAESTGTVRWNNGEANFFINISELVYNAKTDEIVSRRNTFKIPIGKLNVSEIYEDTNIKSYVPL